MTGRITPADYQKKTFGSLSYRYLPPQESSDKMPLPLFIFLHGVGECGTDNESQLWYPFFSDETAVFSRQSLSQFPCHVIAPQAQDDNRWVDIQDWGREVVSLAPTPTPALASVLELIEHLTSIGVADPRRVYLTGLSMGAFGVYDILGRAGELIAAAVAVCGGADLRTVPQLRQTPLRIYHGDRDKVVPVTLSRTLFSDLTAKKANASYIELEQTGHNAWEFAFRDPNLMPWLFSQSL